MKNSGSFTSQPNKTPPTNDNVNDFVNPYGLSLQPQVDVYNVEEVTLNSKEPIYVHSCDEIDLVIAKKSSGKLLVNEKSSEGVSAEKLNEEVHILEKTKEQMKDESSDNFVQRLEESLLSKCYKSLDDAFDAYNEYGIATGFSVRKGKQWQLVRQKWFQCSCQGVKNDKCGGQGAYARNELRTECPAEIRFECSKDGYCKVIKFVKDRNHAMALSYERHFLRSGRHISESNGAILESFANAGIKLSDGISYLINESGGPQNVSFTTKDAYNYHYSLRKSKIDIGDIEGLLSYFRKKKKEDPLFQWDLEMDEDGRLANLFWRDGKSRMDYNYFGDVVSFDTTYRTNKYGLKCAVFVGINHHRQNVILGCVFLSWETRESIEWLFGTFLRSMGGKPPIKKFTDQAQAIMKVVDNKLIGTRHRLCQWHISQNAPSHIGSLNGNKQFWALFHRCLSKCHTEEEFENSWLEILDTFEAHDNSWLIRMYHLRHRWSTAFNNDVFNAGIKSTSRSESTNHVLNGISNLTTCLHDFVIALENKILKKWRENERREDFRCAHSRVPRLDKGSPLLLHASQVYAHTMYKVFESELTRSNLSYNGVEMHFDASNYYFEISKKTKPEKIKKVFFDMKTLEVKCPCRKFESMGILCRHALKILDMKNMYSIPERYIMTRWSKDVKDFISMKMFDSYNLEKENVEPEIIFSNSAMRCAHDIVSKSRPYKDARGIVWKHLRSAKEELTELFRGQSSNTHRPTCEIIF